MHIEPMVLGDFFTNCYIVYKTAPGPCLVIDPADSGPKLISRLEELSLSPAAVLLTHGHYDHILAVPALQERWPDLPVYCHPLDVPGEKTERDMGRVFPTVAAFQNLQPLEDGQELELAGFPIGVLHTPGHTPGSVTFMVEDVLFTGDTLFCRDIGRTDFAGGDDRQMEASLRRLADLPGDFRVLPGHEEATVLSQERLFNPYLRHLRT